MAQLPPPTCTPRGRPDPRGSPGWHTHVLGALSLPASEILLEEPRVKVGWDPGPTGGPSRGQSGSPAHSCFVTFLGETHEIVLSEKRQLLLL